jgi:hypothetical protein
LVARLRTVAAPFGEDALVHFHRYMARNSWACRQPQTGMIFQTDRGRG